MSIKLMTQVWDMKGLSATEKLILLCLADYANDDGICWPSQGAIADKCDCTRPYVNQVVSRFEKDNMLVKENRYKDNKKISNLYRLNLVNRGYVNSVDMGYVNSVDRGVLTPVDTEPSYEPPDKPIKPLTPQQIMFGAILSVTGLDEAALTVKQKVRIGRVAGLLVKAGYAKEDVEYFYKYHWPKDWRGAKGQRPSPENVRDGIKDAKTARIRAGIVTEEIADKNSLSWMYEGEDDE